MNQRAVDPKKPTPGDREAPSRAVEEACPCPQPPPVLDGEMKEAATTVNRGRSDKRDGALQAVQDYAAAEFGPGYRKRMASMSGLEGNSERVRTNVKEARQKHLLVLKVNSCSPFNKRGF